MLSEERRQSNRELSLLAEQNAKKVLKPGDRLRVTKCPGTKRWITFAEWDGHWIVSKSGINDYSPRCVDMLNGEAVDFTKTPNSGNERPPLAGGPLEAVVVGQRVSRGDTAKRQEKEMLKSKFMDKSNNREERMPGWPMDGVPVKRQVGMIYWYSWGKHTFDIRVMRRALGLPEDHPADKWFMAAKPDACGSFSAVMSQLQEALGGHSFHDAMAEHDRLMDADKEAELAAMRERKAKAAATPPAAAPVPF